ncbi:hypothetical protein OROHE_000423 [Orobanche hederae]
MTMISSLNPTYIAVILLSFFFLLSPSYCLNHKHHSDTFRVWFRGGGGESKVGIDAAELSQQMQPVPSMHGGGSADAAESRPSTAELSPTEAAGLLRLVSVVISRQQGSTPWEFMGGDWI